MRLGAAAQHMRATPSAAPSARFVSVETAAIVDLI